MRDNELIQVFLPIIKDALVADGFNNVTVKQSNQPTMQGANIGATVYFYKIGDRRYGWLSRKEEWDDDTEAMIHTEIQLYETTFRLSALVRQNPSRPDLYTASDLVNECAAILQSDSTLIDLGEDNIGILRISDISNPYFLDDRDQFEASPSFDFTLTHRQTRVSTIPVLDLEELDIKRI